MAGNEQCTTQFPPIVSLLQKRYLFLLKCDAKQLQNATYYFSSLEHWSGKCVNLLGCTH